MSMKQINIVHLYPDLLNLYGDKGNIETLRKRLLWRGIDANIIECTCNCPQIDFENADIIFLGGGSEREQNIVLSRLMEEREEFIRYVENDGCLLAVCGGFELLGKKIKTAQKEIEALGILDVVTDLTSSDNRLIGNVIIESQDICEKIVGFENHGGRVDIGKHTPLGKVLKGYGNNGKSGYEGVVYKNVIATYLHGPLLPKNPALCDVILSKALQKKYSDFSGLSPLDDEIETKANNYIVSILL